MSPYPRAEELRPPPASPATTTAYGFDVTADGVTIVRADLAPDGTITVTPVVVMGDAGAPLPLAGPWDPREWSREWSRRVTESWRVSGDAASWSPDDGVTW